MHIKLFRSYNAGQVIEPVVGSDSLEVEFRARGYTYYFPIKRGDLEPKLIIQFSVFDPQSITLDSQALDLSIKDGGPPFSVRASMSFITHLYATINSRTTRVMSVYDRRYTKDCLIVTGNEKMRVLNFFHDPVAKTTLLNVDRQSGGSSHVKGARLVVIRSRPNASILKPESGMVLIDWSERDVEISGDYILEVTLERIVGDKKVKFSISPILVYIEDDYDLE